MRCIALVEDDPRLPRQIRTYLDRMKQKICACELVDRTDNRALDAILTSKSLHCHDRKSIRAMVAQHGGLMTVQGENSWLGLHSFILRPTV